MKMIISPSKSLDFKRRLPASVYSEPLFINEAAILNEHLKKKSVRSLSKLMNISTKLSELNWQRNQSFTLPFTPSNARPAVYAFNGNVYVKLDAFSLNEKKTKRMQSQLRILSGLYGLLSPLDLIQPYRLEMGTLFAVGKYKNLYDFWKIKITKRLNEELEEGELFVNLASNEYFSAVDSKKLKATIITPQFKDFKNGKLKTISFFAKNARGMMTRFIIDNDIKRLGDLLGFSSEGYEYSESQTKNRLHPVFIR